MYTVNAVSQIRSYVSRFLCAGFLATAFQSQAAPVLGGPSDGGGGGAFVCRQAGVVQSSELIDLWEAKNRPYRWADKASVYKLTIPYSNEDVNVQVNRAIKKLAEADPALAIRVRGLVNIIRHRTLALPEEISVEVPPDALAVYSKTGCPPEGMMFYDDADGALNVKQEVFDKLLNNTNIAAAITHEALYKAFRDMRARNELSSPLTDSTPVRRINACLYATDDCLGVAGAASQVARDGSVKCVSRDYTVYAKREGKAGRNGNMDSEFQILDVVRAGPFTYKAPLRMRIEIVSYGKDLSKAYNSPGIFAKAYTQVSGWLRDYEGIDSRAGYPILAVDNGKVQEMKFPALMIEGTETRLPEQTFTCTPN